MSRVKNHEHDHLLGQLRRAGSIDCRKGNVAQRYLGSYTTAIALRTVCRQSETASDAASLRRSTIIAADNLSLQVLKVTSHTTSQGGISFPFSVSISRFLLWRTTSDSRRSSGHGEVDARLESLALSEPVPLDDLSQHQLRAPQQTPRSHINGPLANNAKGTHTQAPGVVHFPPSSGTVALKCVWFLGGSSEAA